MANPLDPFNLLGRSVGVARLGLRVASWTEQQAMQILRNRLDAVAPQPLALAAGSAARMAE